MVTIYLDNCGLQRPYDDQSQVRIQLEAQAILAVITLFEQQKIELISSETLYFEAEQNPHLHRRRYVLRLLDRISHYYETTDVIVHRANQYESSGLQSFDALHLATSVEAKANYFCSCDDRLLKRAKQLDTGSTRVVSPLELIEVLEP